mmetsp:Transcript_8013/g.12880  ORF Transcript_8013/g.12880 Transcript_8013/m.12880 type:complete len:213 (-) Transcript_8013:150-788(-)
MMLSGMIVAMSARQVAIASPDAERSRDDVLEPNETSIGGGGCFLSNDEVLIGRGRSGDRPTSPRGVTRPLKRGEAFPSKDDVLVRRELRMAPSRGREFWLSSISRMVGRVGPSGVGGMGEEGAEDWRRVPSLEGERGRLRQLFRDAGLETRLSREGEATRVFLAWPSSTLFARAPNRSEFRDSEQDLVQGLTQMNMRVLELLPGAPRESRMR